MSRAYLGVSTSPLAGEPGVPTRALWTLNRLQLGLFLAELGKDQLVQAVSGSLLSEPRLGPGKMLPAPRICAPKWSPSHKTSDLPAFLFGLWIEAFGGRATLNEGRVSAAMCAAT